MMDFLNYVAHLHIWHCQMQDKKYLWLQLERIPDLISEPGGFSHCTPWPDWAGKQRPSPDHTQVLPCTSSCEPSSVHAWKGEALAGHISHHDLMEAQAALSQVPHSLCVWTQLPPQDLPDLPVHCKFFPNSNRASLPDCCFGHCSTAQLWGHWTSALHSSHVDFCPWASSYSACSMVGLCSGAVGDCQGQHSGCGSAQGCELHQITPVPSTAGTLSLLVVLEDHGGFGCRQIMWEQTLVCLPAHPLHAVSACHLLCAHCGSTLPGPQTLLRPVEHRVQRIVTRTTRGIANEPCKAQKK